MAEHGEPLSQREREVLELVATGATNRQIAQELVVSVNTVKVHLRNIFTKLGVESRTEATLIAIREGWVGVQAEETGPEEPETAATPAPPKSLPVEGPVRTLPPLPWPKRLALIVSLILVVWVSAATWPRPHNAAAPLSPHTDTLPESISDGGPEGENTNWHQLAPMNLARSRFALIATSDRHLYAIGGETNGGVTGAVELYDPGTNQWTTLTASKPTRVSNIGAAIIGEWIYVPGGWTAEGAPTAIVEAYNLRDEDWSQVAPLPRPLSAYALAVYQGQIYLFGGGDDREYVNTTYIYDPQKDSWQEGARMPTRRAYAAAAPLGPNIFVVGGYDGRREHATCETYSPEKDAWTACELLTLPRSGLGLASVANGLFAVGGGWSSYFGFNEKYNPDAQGWTPFQTPVIRQWHNLAIASTPNRFYAAGGWKGGYLNGVWEYRVLPFEINLPFTGIGQ